MQRSAPLLLLLALPALPARAGTTPPRITVETEHYALSAEATEGVAEEYGRVLEAAWPLLASFFGAAPRQKGGERLPVVFCATRASFEARMRRDGVTPPAAGGYYCPRNRTAYAWRQPTIYYTRCLLLHEATHQFHYLARTDDRTSLEGWYAEGLAEFLSRHTWDGKTLVLGVVPPLSLTDYPKAALDLLAAKDADLEKLLAGGTLSRPAAFAVVRYLVTADGGRHRKRFDRIASKLDRGNRTPDLLFEAFGPPGRLREAIAAWLPSVQEPWTPVFNEWEGTSKGCFRGTAGPGIVSACRIKGDASELSALYRVPKEKGWLAGLLLAYSGKDDYTIGLATDDGRVRVHRRRDGAWEHLLDGSLPGDPGASGTIRFEAERQGDAVRFRVDGLTIGSFDLPGRTLGLAMQGGVADFEDVRWR